MAQAEAAAEDLEEVAVVDLAAVARVWEAGEPPASAHRRRRNGSMWTVRWRRMRCAIENS